jgi:hypothetical protein
MRKFLAGGVATLLLTTGVVMLWRGNAAPEQEIPKPPPAEPEGLLTLPDAGPNGPKFGKAPPRQPTPPAAPKKSREEMRFNRYDRDKDELISRLEMMSSRSNAFKKLDRDSNNLLSFEEWAGATNERFMKADTNKNSLLTREEFATTRPKKAAKAACNC